MAPRAGERRRFAGLVAAALLPAVLGCAAGAAVAPRPAKAGERTRPPAAAAAASDLGPPPLDAPLPLPGDLPIAANDVPPPPDDLEEFLYAHRLNFAAGGAPLVTVRVMEGQESLTLEGSDRLDLALHGAEPTGPRKVGVPPHQPLTVRLSQSAPALLQSFPQVADLAFDDRSGLAAARTLWEGRGYAVEVRTIGTVYGVAGRVLDNRRTLVLLGAGGDAAAANAQLDAIRSQTQTDDEALGTQLQIYEELVRRPSGTLTLQDESGATVAASQDVLAIDSPGEVLVRRVEFGVGYAFHGYQDRRYRGRLFAAVDKLGKLALVEALPLEELLRGLVPSEIPAGAPAEALKAQAVTARGEVLAKIGARHLTDPYVLCDEQHCQVYGGLGSERSSTDAAVSATHGEGLFAGGSGKLVDSVYSAVCGGHTEDNEVVWGGPPDPSLRGVSDAAGQPPEPSNAVGDLRSEAALRRWLSTTPESYCRLAAGTPPGKVRWTRHFSGPELDALLAPLGVGRVRALVPSGRGASGRASRLRISGDRGSAEIRGELRIRKLLRNLNSAAFVVDVEGEDGSGGVSRPAVFVLRGAGWGHGVGMCQWGAIGRAAAGQGYRKILRAYFNGAELTKIY